MTAREYAQAHDIGYRGAVSIIGDARELDYDVFATGRLDRDDVDDRAFPDAFSEALEALPELEAPEISDAVHAGISDAYDQEV